MHVKPSFNPNNNGNFKNRWGISNEPMKNGLSGALTFPIVPQVARYNLDLVFYYSEDKSIAGGKLKDDKYLSTKVNVSQVSIGVLQFSHSIDSCRCPVFEASWIVPRYPRVLHLLRMCHRITATQTLLTPRTTGLRRRHA